MRFPSHAVLGSWVDLYKNHLETNKKTGLFSPKSTFSEVDERLLGPIAFLVLDATAPYLLRYFSDMHETKLLLTRMADLVNRIIVVGEAHERLFSAN
jgi:hypothetical protein